MANGRRLKEISMQERLDQEEKKKKESPPIINSGVSREEAEDTFITKPVKDVSAIPKVPSYTDTPYSRPTKSGAPLAPQQPAAPETPKAEGDKESGYKAAVERIGIKADRKWFEGKLKDIDKEYDKATESVERQRAMSIIGEALTKWGAAQQGVTGLKFKRPDYERKLDRLMEGKKAKTGAVVSGFKESEQTKRVDASLSNAQRKMEAATKLKARELKAKLKLNMTRDDGSTMNGEQAKFLGFMLGSESAERTLSKGHVPSKSKLEFQEEFRNARTLPIIGAGHEYVQGLWGTSSTQGEWFDRLTTEDQKYVQAANQWILNVLRKESGAAVTAEEYQQYWQTYMPMAGNTPETLEHKAAKRREKVEELRETTGNTRIKLFWENK